METGKWGGKAVIQITVKLFILGLKWSYNFFSDRGIFLTVLNHVDNWWLLYLCHMWTYWFLQYGEILPFFCFLALCKLRRFCFFPLKETRPHWIACTCPSRPFSITPLDLLVHLVPSRWVDLLFLSTWKVVTCFLCLGSGISLVGRPSTSNSMPLLYVTLIRIV